MKAPCLFFVALMAAPRADAAIDDRRLSATERYRGAMVRDITIVLDGGVLPEATRDLIEISAGDVYRPETIRRSIQQLFALGTFSDIKVEAQRFDELVDLRFHLFPRVTVEAIEIRGLEADSRLEDLRSRLVRESDLSAGDSLEVEVLDAAAERVEQILHEEGYLWAVVEPEASFQSPSAVVVFHVEAGPGASIASIEIGGLEPHVANHVRRELGVDVGELYAKSNLDEGVEKIIEGWHVRGFYNAQLEAEASPTDDGRVNLSLSGELGPQVLIEVEGTDLSDETIRSLVPIYEENRVTEDLIEESRANLEDHLRANGHRDARVRLDRVPDVTGHYLFVRFVGEPGPRYEVEAIEIEGLAAVSDSEVRDLMATTTRGPFRDAPFRQDVWEDDLDEIRDYLEQQGYHRASVTGETRVPTGPAATASDEVPVPLTLVARIEEGPRAQLESVQVEEASQVDPRTVLRVSALAPSQPFDPSGVVEARDRIVTYYRNRGFGDVDVQARTSVTPDGTGASVSFRVREGTQTLVDRVILSGLQASKESAIRKLVAIEPGAPLSPRQILQTRQRLVGSGLFRSVSVEVLPVDPLTDSSDVLISLVEGPRTTFAYGFGFQERTLLRAEAEVTRRNLFGSNRSVSVFARASFRGGRFITTYRQPETFARDLPLFVSGFAEEEQRTSFSYNRLGVGLQISKRFDENDTFFLRYRFDRTKLFDVLIDIDEIDRRFRNVRIGAVSADMVTDERDDPLNPSGGQFRILDLEWSTRILGSEAPYLKGLAQQFFYLPMPKGMVAAVGGRLGLATTLGEELDLPIPIAERFFAGGSTTLRGFALDQAGPKQKVILEDEDGNDVVVDGQPTGGDTLVLLNLELRFPIFRNLRGVFFSDMGNVARNPRALGADGLRYNMGFGFRYDTPLGPLRVDYGFKLDRRTFRSINCPDPLVPCTESFGRWHVSLGNAF